MAKRRQSSKGVGITIECVSCKARKVIPFEEAAKLKDVPFCEKDGMPMVTVEART